MDYGNDNLARRVDHELRQSINQLQHLLFDPNALDRIGELMLEEIMRLTEAKLGVVVKVQKGFMWEAREQNFVQNATNGLGYLQYLPPQDRSSVPFNPAAVAGLIEQGNILHRPLVFNDEIPSDYLSPFGESLSFSALLIQPIVEADRIVCVIFVAKSQGTFAANTKDRLSALMGAAGCALTSTGHIKGVAPLIEAELNGSVFLNSLIASSPVAILTTDETDKIVLANASAASMLGLTKEHLLGKNINQFMPHFGGLFQWSNQGKYDGLHKTHREQPEAFKEDQVGRKFGGEEFVARLSVFRFTHGGHRFTTLQILDVTSKQNRVNDYRRTWMQFNALTHLVPVGIIHVDDRWNCIYSNDTWYNLAGVNADETVGSGWINAFDADDVSPVLEGLRSELSKTGEYACECRLSSPLGMVTWVEMHARALYADDGKMLGFLATFADITERLKIQEELRQVAEYDGLTGLPNRNLFQDRLQQVFMLSERDKSNVVVMLIDLDGFKDVNDTFGHDVGDELLSLVGERFLNVLRNSDTVARFGGDEYAVLLGHHEGSAQVEAVAQKLCRALELPLTIGQEDLYLTTSIGIAIGKATTHSPQTIMKQADIALYRAKNDGKNKFRFYSEALDQKSQLRMHMSKCLRSAAELNQFRLVYQPQACVNTGKITGIELLMRWQHSELGMVPPIHFIPLLEDTHLICKVGLWSIEQAFREVRQWWDDNELPKDCKISLNISPRQLVDDNLASDIAALLQKYEIPERQIVCEITESVLIQRADRARIILQELRDLGIKIALDDFGTGYSSLSYLQRFPIDQIKIDKSFVQDILSDENDAKITKAIISLSQSLGLEVLAEGVESPECLARLKDFGCDYYQGFLLSEPKSKQALTPLLTQC